MPSIDINGCSSDSVLFISTLYGDTCSSIELSYMRLSSYLLVKSLNISGLTIHLAGLVIILLSIIVNFKLLIYLYIVIYGSVSGL